VQLSADRPAGMAGREQTDPDDDRGKQEVPEGVRSRIEDLVEVLHSEHPFGPTEIDQGSVAR
jgi:hypothetical protein